MNNCTLTLVIPCYNKAQNLQGSIETLQSYLQELTDSYEIMLVDDGSIDETFKIITKNSETDGRIKGIRFSRNFGKEAAIFAGLKNANGDAVIIMDADLQHPPSMIKSLYNHWKDEGYEIVEAVKSYKKKRTFFTTIRSSVFNYLMTKLTGFEMHGASDFKLLDKRVVTTLINLPEKNRLFRGLTNWTGYKNKQINFEVEERSGGETKWSLLALVKLSVTAITSFSNIPLQMITTLGLFTLVISFFLIFQTLFIKFTGEAVSGFTTVIVLTLFLNSIIMISLGIIGVYLANIYMELKRRPTFLISEETEQKPN